jgi:hypothetical protein
MSSFVPADAQTATARKTINRVNFFMLTLEFFQRRGAEEAARENLNSLPSSAPSR